MSKEEKYYLVKKKAVPEVLLKVVEAKRLLDAEKVLTVQEATDLVGISRSSFYKYKNDIFPFHDDSRGKTITIMLQLDDEPGLLSRILHQVAEHSANILTIHQSIPVGGIASLTVSLQTDSTRAQVTDMIEDIEALEGIHSLKILARE
ncbi:ACT domain-containing protein [Anaerolentibacter hominis]|uniref:ACT domain-containing protein n=1 Tax=Anaerolentibacter hominis TaxID=3079009 RepID=UPI0031B8075C